MGLEEAEQARPLRHLREQGLIVACQPAVERPRPFAFEGIEKSQGHNFTEIQFGTRALGNAQHLLVHSAEQCDNKIVGSHTACSSVLKALTNLNCEGIYDYLSTRVIYSFSN